MPIRDETPGDTTAITEVINEAFRTVPYACGREAAIVLALRAAGALTLSLVADEAGTVTGQLAASDARIGAQAGWHLIGPLAVLPAWQGRGLGSALMYAAIDRLRPAGHGIALVGNPAFYGRFGFRAFPGLTVPGVPPEVVLALPFGAAGQQGVPQGELYHHPAFGLDQSGGG